MPTTTPDGSYLVVRGRLWHATKPAIEPKRRDILVREVMAARRAVHAATGDPEALIKARASVDTAM